MKKRALTLQEHQAVLYDLLYVFDDFCNKCNIQYFLAAGTLLGAIRHSGIIPWDDDVDVMLPRPEYDRLLQLMHKNCPSGYKIYDIDNTKRYYYPFAKFGRKGTLLIEDDWHCVPSEGVAINIDIFPIDGCPCGIEIAQEFALNTFNVNLRKLRFWFDTEDNKSLPLWIRAKLLLKYCPFVMKHLFKLAYKRVSTYQYNDSEFVANIAWGWSGKKEVMEKSNFSDVLFFPFGERQLPVPIGYDKYLTNIYGDYMTPPPLDRRNSTHKHENLFIIE